MPRDAGTWLVALTSAAPRVDRTLLRILAELLAEPATPRDLLFNAADALGDASRDALLESRLRDACEISALAMFVANAALHPRPGFW
jgi:hypothetical protein